MTAVEKRFLTGFRSADADTPGLIQEDDGTVWLVAPDGTRTQISGGGSSSAFAQVSRSTTLDPWDGSALPFDHISHDPDGLWDATNHQFVAAVAGWYQVILWSNQAGGFGIFATTSVQVVNSGAGDNIKTNLHSAEGSEIILPTGVTHLAVGDTLDVEGAGDPMVVGAGTTFSLLLIATT